VCMDELCIVMHVNVHMLSNAHEVVFDVMHEAMFCVVDVVMH